MNRLNFWFQWWVVLGWALILAINRAQLHFLLHHLIWVSWFYFLFVYFDLSFDLGWINSPIFLLRPQLCSPFVFVWFRLKLLQGGDGFNLILRLELFWLWVVSCRFWTLLSPFSGSLIWMKLILVSEWTWMWGKLSKARMPYWWNCLLIALFLGFCCEFSF